MIQRRIGGGGSAEAPASPLQADVFHQLCSLAAQILMGGRSCWLHLAPGHFFSSRSLFSFHVQNVTNGG